MAFRIAPLGPCRHACKLRRPQRGEPLALRYILQRRGERLGVRVLEASARLDVGVVRDHVSMGDAAGVVVVVDDGDLVFGEVLGRPCRRELPQRLKAYAVLRVGRYSTLMEMQRMVDRFTQALLGDQHANNRGDAIMRDLGYDRFDVPQEQDCEVVLEAVEAIGSHSTLSRD